MTSPPDPGVEASVLVFDSFELDVRTAELRRNGVLVKLQQQPLRVLALLARRSGDLVTREEIKREIWSNETFVDFDQGLNFCIKQVRSALGDHADTPRYIETLPRRGYRFLAPVAVRGASRRAEASEAVAVDGAEKKRPRSPRALGVAIAAILLAAASGAYYATRAGRAKSSEAPRVSLVVLPFQNLSSDPEQEYFSDGLTDEMIAQLGRLDPKRLAVIARGSSMQYKNRVTDVASVGRELGVDYVVEGSVRRGGDRVRITAKLIKAQDRTQIWSESYERDLKDILDLQSEVARDVARGVRITLSPAAERRLSSSRAVDPEAYKLYLQGRFYWNQRDAAGLLRSIQSFTQALDRQPDNALAYVGLADARIVLVDQGNMSAHEGMPKAKDAALKALSLDPDLAEAHASLAMIRGTFDWEWASAEASFRRAIELNPNYPTAHHWYSHLLRSLGRFEEAIAQTREARTLDPLSLIINNNVGSALFYAGKYTEAESQYRRVLEINARFAPGHWGLGRVSLRMGRTDQAIAFHEKAVEFSARDAGYLCTLGHALAEAGRTREAQKILAEVEAMAKVRYVAPYDLALVHAGLGDRQGALDLLERAVDERYTGVRQLRIDERLESLRGEARFEALCRRVGLP